MKQERQEQVLGAHESNYFDQSASCKLEKIQNRGNSAEASYGPIEGCSQEPLLNHSEEDGGSLLRVIRGADGDLSSCAAAESTSARPFENTVCKNSRRPLPTHGKRPDDYYYYGDDYDDDDDLITIILFIDVVIIIMIRIITIYIPQYTSVYTCTRLFYRMTIGLYTSCILFNTSVHFIFGNMVHKN